MHTSHIICHDKDFRCLKMLLTASQRAQTRPEALYPSKNALGGKKQRSLSDSTQLTFFFLFLCSPHVFKKCWILRQVRICFFTTGGEKLILGRSRNIKKKSHRKRAVLPPRPAIGSSPGNTKAFLE